MFVSKYSQEKRPARKTRITQIERMQADDRVFVTSSDLYGYQEGEGTVHHTKLACGDHGYATVAYVEMDGIGPWYVTSDKDISIEKI